MIYVGDTVAAGAHLNFDCDLGIWVHVWQAVAHAHRGSRPVQAAEVHDGPQLYDLGHIDHPLWHPLGKELEVANIAFDCPSLVALCAAVAAPTQGLFVE